MASRSFDLKASLLLGATVLCWASIPVLIRDLARFIDAWTANGLRYPMAALLYLPILLAARRGGRLDPGLFRRALVPAAVAFAGQILWALAPYYLEAGPIAFLVQTCVAWGLVGSMLLFREERGLLRSSAFHAGLALAAGGAAALAIGRGALDTAATRTGVLIILACAVFFGLYSPCIRRFMRHDPPVLAFGVVAQYVSAGTLVLMFWLGDWRRAGEMGARAWGVTAASAVLGVALAHVLLYAAIQRIGTAIPQGVSLVTPFVTLVLAALALGETLSPAQIGSGAAMVAGGGLLLLSQQRVVPALEAPVRAAGPP